MTKIIIKEFVSLFLQIILEEKLLKGGRYFAKNFDQQEESTGFTCYMDTILRASSFKQITKKIMIEFKLSKIKKNAIN